MVLQQFEHRGPTNPVLGLSNPRAASQQVQFGVPANHCVCCILEIPVLCSTVPNTVFQQHQCHLPANPVAWLSQPSTPCQQSPCCMPGSPVSCSSNPSATSQQTKCCVSANQVLCLNPELCPSKPGAVSQQSQCHVPAIQLSASTAAPTKPGQDAPVGRWGLWFRPWLGLERSSGREVRTPLSASSPAISTGGPGSLVFGAAALELTVPNVLFV